MHDSKYHMYYLWRWLLLIEAFFFHKKKIQKKYCSYENRQILIYIVRRTNFQLRSLTPSKVIQETSILGWCSRYI